MSDPAISVERLGKRYTLRHRASAGGLLRDRIAQLFRPSRPTETNEEFWALQDLSFTVNPGDVVGIIGRNGAGKSTLLKILSRITEPTTGRVTIQGRVASLLEVGTGFHGELSGRENVFLNGAILGMTRAEIRRKFDEIVAFAEVEKFLDTPVKHYSSGMYVRLAFAVAAHLEPEILIVDEVLAVGDASFQKKCLGKMREVASGHGRTVLFVSHQLASVTSLCDRGIWLENGRVRMCDTAERTAAAYVQCFTPENANVFDLTKFPRPPSHSGKLAISRLELNGGMPLVNREPMTARLHVSTTLAVEGVSFGLGFASLEGTRLLTIDSDYHGLRRDLPAGFRGVVEFKLPALLLGPGTFGIDVGARSGETVALDYLANCGAAEVHPRAGVPAGFAMIGGGVRAEAEWSWSST